MRTVCFTRRRVIVHDTTRRAWGCHRMGSPAILPNQAPNLQTHICRATIAHTETNKVSEAMRLYLDTCTLQRPLDDRSQLRIALEADAVLAILSLCHQQIHQLVVSDVTVFEITRNPNAQRRTFAHAIIAQAAEHQILTDSIEQRARLLEQAGVKAIDALHWAAAEHTAVDYFCTCDDRFYRKIKALPDCTLAIVTPLELAQEIVR